MKNRRVVYVLGAGFSATLGLPTISTFYKASRDLFRSNSVEFAHFQKVYDYINSHPSHHMPADYFNIEELLSLIDMEVAVGEIDDQGLISDFVRSVITSYTPQLAYGKDPVGSSHDGFFNVTGDYLHEFKAIFAFILQLSRVNIITTGTSRGNHLASEAVINETSNTGTEYGLVTFNYDTVIEQCVSMINKRLWQGHRIILDFGQTIDPPNSDEVHAVVPFSKLHGSLANGLTFEHDEIVPPTSMKNLSERIREQWRLAYQQLSKADEIRFIGYSLPLADSYIEYLMKISLSKNIDLNTILSICLDDTGLVEKRYRNVFGRVGSCSLLSITAMDYLTNTCKPQDPSMKSAGPEGYRGMIQYNTLEAQHDRYVKDLLKAQRAK